MENVPYVSAIKNLIYAIVSTIKNLIYAIVRTKSYISRAIGVVNRYINNPGKIHWKVVKWILIYL